MLPDDDPQKQVVTDYRQATRAPTKQPVSTFGGHAYDGLRILVDAMKRAGSTDPQTIRDEIEKTKGFVGTGGVVNMSPAPTTSASTSRRSACSRSRTATGPGARVS